MSSPERVALQSLVAAVNCYQTPRDIVNAAMAGKIDGDAWSHSWDAIRSAKQEAEAILSRADDKSGEK